jgi:Fe-S cluster assembly iron-binding protein IscA
MFQLSQKAAQEMKRIKDEVVQEQQAEPGSMLRLIHSGEREFNMTIGLPEEGDRELYCADEKVLVVDAETSTVLVDVTLDYQDTPQGHKFVFEMRAE